MNRIYKVIWSKTKHCYVVVSELAKRHTKGGSAGGCRMMTARVLSTLLLGAYLVGGYNLPSAWADGDSITVTSDGGVQWGKSTEASGIYSTAWGHSAVADGAYSTAIGATGDGSTNQPTASWAQAAYSLAAIGGTTNTGAISSVAIGVAYDESSNQPFKPSTTNAAYSMALLGGTTVYDESESINATNSLAIGLGSVTKGANTVAVLGGVTESTATNSLAVGAGATTSGMRTVALGYGRFDGNELVADSGPVAAGKGAIAVGADAVANGENTIALGAVYTNTGSKYFENSIANGTNTLAVLGGKTGYKDSTNSFDTTGAIALGGAYDTEKGEFVSSTANADYSLALLGGVTGDMSGDTQVGQNSLAIGLGSVAEAANSIALLGGRTVYDSSDSTNVINAANSR